MSYCDKNIEVSKDYPLYESEKGRYFIGQTPIISGQTKQALVKLKNPIKSNRNIYLNAMTITNISNSNLSAEFYLRSNFKNGIQSKLISCANTSISPKPSHKGQIKYLTSANKGPTGGVAIFSRIVPQNSTLVVDGGQIILGPDQSIIIYIGSFLPVNFYGVKFAFGWYEKELYDYDDDCY